MEVPDSQSAAAQPQPPQTKRYSVDSDYFEPYRPSSIESSVKPYVILCQHIQEKIDELQRVECDHERAVAHAELLCLPREKVSLWCCIPKVSFK